MLIDIIIGQNPDIKAVKNIIREINTNSHLNYRIVQAGKYCEKGIPLPNIQIGANNIYAKNHLQRVAKLYKEILIESPCNLCLISENSEATKACLKVAREMNIETRIYSKDFQLAHAF